MKLKLQTLPTVAILAILLTIPASARADAVGDWNRIAFEATAKTAPGIPARPGPTGALDIAMVQAAIYDAVQAIEKEFEPYYVEIQGASGSPVAATAKAARDVLVNRFPWQTTDLDTIYFNYLAPLGLLDDPGVAVGAKAAAGIIALRACDGSFPSPSPTPFTGGTDPGVWRPTPPANAAMLAPWLGFVTPFTLTRPSQFRAEPPPALTSRQYARDYNEVKALGKNNSTVRTPEQTELAHFWNLNYVRVWNEVLRNIAEARVHNISDSARLFALADMAMADAIITAWNSKSYYVFWRPITAIQLGHTDGNSRTDGDPTWESLIVNPPYPDYTSGANNVTASATTSLALFFGRDRLTFSVTTTNLDLTMQDTRRFRFFSDAQEEVVDARIYEGIHFRFADTAARKQGIQVASWAFKNFLRPLHEEDHHDEHKDDHGHDH